MQKFCHIIKLSLFVIVVTTFFSCSSYRKMTYLQNLSSSDSLIVNTYQTQEYRVQPGDILYIRIVSLSKEINELFNPTDIIQTVNINEASLYYKSYQIFEDGNIELPVIGKVNVANKTLFEIHNILQNKTSEYFKEAYVVVKYGGFKVTVLGEVRKPGVFYLYNSKVTILEALGNAGDLTEYANREKILVLRNTVKGLKTFKLNLLDKTLLNSPNLYVQPNDIIYVEALKTKSWRLNSYNISIILSSISTLILVINFVLKL